MKKPKPPLGCVIPLHHICDEGHCIYCGETNVKPKRLELEACPGPLPLRESILSAKQANHNLLAKLEQAEDEIERLRFLFRLALNPDSVSRKELLRVFAPLRAAGDKQENHNG